MKLKIALTSFKLTSKSLHLIFSLVFLFILTYFFGYKLLTGGLLGNDSPNSFSFVVWLDKFYPNVPLWYPLQGSGVSFTQGYQLFPHLIVVWLHRFSSLSLIQAFELISFLSVFGSAAALYIFAWSRMRSQTVGLIAGTFFLLSPVTWVWTTQAGFFAAAFSLVFFPLALIFVDWYLELCFQEGQIKKKRIVFFSAVFFLSLALLSHFTTFMALLVLSFFYFVLFALVKERKNYFGNIFKAVKSFFLLFFSTFLLTCFWFSSFYIYSSFANWDRSNNPDPNLFPAININSFLSIPVEVFKVGSVWTFSFPLYVWVLALAAVIISIFYSKRIFAIALTSVFVLFVSVNIGFYIFVSKYFPFLASGFSPRIFWVAYNFLAPLLAAYTIYFGVNLLILKPLKKFFGERKYFAPVGTIASVLVAIVSLGISTFLIVNVRSVDLSGAHSFAHYGPIYTYPALYRSYDAGQIYGAGLDLRDIWERSSEEDLNYLVAVKTSSKEDIKTIDKQKKVHGSTLLKTGDKVYSDRDYTIEKVPDRLDKYFWVSISNNDKDNSESDLLNIALKESSEILIAYDELNPKVPTWLESNFTKTNDFLTILGGKKERRLRIYTIKTPVTSITLGGNKARGFEGPFLTVEVPDKTTKDGFAKYSCPYSIDKTIADLCEKNGAVATLSGIVSQLQPDSWPKLQLANPNMTSSEEVDKLLSPLPPSENLRIDISPRTYGALTSRLSIYRQDISLLNVYTFQLSLNHVFWANAQGVLYSQDGETLYKDPKVLNQVTSYFGLNYIFLGGNEPIDKYKKAGWEVEELKDKSGNIVKSQVQRELFEVTDKPAVLVVGKAKVDSYQSVFKTGILGALPYEKGLLVMGKDNIDDQSLEELKKFDLIILNAYSYKSKKAWNELKKYVEDGGHVFVDTGWQYNVPDWQDDKTAELLPIEKLEWKNLATSSSYKTGDKTLLSEDSLKKFNSLTWNGAAWGVSTGKNLRDNSKVLLSYDGYPLVVSRKVGQGEIVWSGMNLISHSLINDNVAENSFLGNVFDRLLPVKGEEFSASMKRVNPDKVEFTLNQNIPDRSNLFFREAFIPNWKATLQTSSGNKDLKLYRAGPGLLLAKLPSASGGDKIVLEFKLTTTEFLAYIVSILTAIFMVLYLVDSLVLNGRILRKISLKIGKQSIPIKLPGKKWLEEESEDD